MFTCLFLFRQPLCTILDTSNRIPLLRRTAPQTYSKDSKNGPHNLDEAGLDEKTGLQLKNLQLELELFYEEGLKVCAPQHVTLHDWKHILTLSTRSARMKEYKYLESRVVNNIAEKQKNERLKVENKARTEDVLKSRLENPHIIYGLKHTALIPLIAKATIDRIGSNRLRLRREFESPKIVFDCSFDNMLTKKTASSISRQMVLSYSNNRDNLQPFDMHICNFDTRMKLPDQLQRIMPNLLQSSFEVHAECFTELYPKENLVYLTPDSPHVLNEYNSRDIFVIASLVEKSDCINLVSSRAKEIGIRTAWFPLNLYLNWGKVFRGLPLNIVTDVLLELKSSRDMRDALKRVPKRMSKSGCSDRVLRRNGIPSDDFNSIEKTSNVTNFQDNFIFK